MSLITTDLVVLVITATLLAILAKKTNQPPLVAYVLTGMILGPAILNVVSETQAIKLFSELGLGFLLFLLGIEMNLKEIRDLLRPITNIAIWQTIMQTSLAFMIAFALGFSLVETSIVALCTVFGATPVIVKLLADKGEITSLPGKIDVGVLIIQDIILVVYLALFSAESLANISAVGGALIKIFALIGLIGALSYLSSQYFLPKLLKQIADNKHTFFVYGIGWVFLFISLSIYLGLSIEIGAFLAGLGLGQIPYREELKERVRPLTDFFMVIFFSSIGLTLGISNLSAYWVEAVIASAVLMFGNFLIMFYLIKRQGFDKETTFIGSINMTQVSEFSLVVGGLAVARQTGVFAQIGPDILGYISLMALITMPLSAYLINYNKQIYEKVEHLLGSFKSEDTTGKDVEFLDEHAIIVGYNDIAEKILPIVNNYFDQVIVIDRKSYNVDKLEKESVKYIFGDFDHEEIRRTAGLSRANLILSFSKEERLNKEILRTCKDSSLVFQAVDDTELASELYDLGADYIIRENTLTAEKMMDYLEDYFNSPDRFKERIETDKESILWGGRSV